MKEPEGAKHRGDGSVKSPVPKPPASSPSLHNGTPDPSSATSFASASAPSVPHHLLSPPGFSRPIRSENPSSQPRFWPADLSAFTSHQPRLLGSFSGRIIEELHDLPPPESELSTPASSSSSSTSSLYSPRQNYNNINGVRATGLQSSTAYRSRGGEVYSMNEDAIPLSTSSDASVTNVLNDPSFLDVMRSLESSSGRISEISDNNQVTLLNISSLSRGNMISGTNSAQAKAKQDIFSSGDAEEPTLYFLQVSGFRAKASLVPITIRYVQSTDSSPDSLRVNQHLSGSGLRELMATLFGGGERNHNAVFPEENRMYTSFRGIHDPDIERDVMASSNGQVAHKMVEHGFDASVFSRSVRTDGWQPQICPYVLRGPPLALQKFTNSVDTRRIAQWRILNNIMNSVNCTSPVAPDLEHLAADFFGGKEVVEDYEDGTTDLVPSDGDKYYKIDYGTSDWAKMVESQPLRDQAFTTFLQDVCLANELEEHCAAKTKLDNLKIFRHKKYDSILTRFEKLERVKTKRLRKFQTVADDFTRKGVSPVAEQFIDHLIAKEGVTVIPLPEPVSTIGNESPNPNSDPSLLQCTPVPQIDGVEVSVTETASPAALVTVTTEDLTTPGNLEPGYNCILETKEADTVPTLRAMEAVTTVEAKDLSEAQTANSVSKELTTNGSALGSTSKGSISQLEVAKTRNSGSQKQENQVDRAKKAKNAKHAKSKKQAKPKSDSQLLSSTPETFPLTEASSLDKSPGKTTETTETRTFSTGNEKSNVAAQDNVPNISPNDSAPNSSVQDIVPSSSTPESGDWVEVKSRSAHRPKGAASIANSQPQSNLASGSRVIPGPRPPIPRPVHQKPFAANKQAPRPKPSPSVGASSKLLPSPAVPSDIPGTSQHNGVSMAADDPTQSLRFFDPSEFPAMPFKSIKSTAVGPVSNKVSPFTNASNIDKTQLQQKLGISEEAVKPVKARAPAKTENETTGSDESSHFDESGKKSKAEKPSKIRGKNTGVRDKQYEQPDKLAEGKLSANGKNDPAGPLESSKSEKTARRASKPSNSKNHGTESQKNKKSEESNNAIAGVELANNQTQSSAPHENGNLKKPAKRSRAKKFQIVQSSTTGAHQLSIPEQSSGPPEVKNSPPTQAMGMQDNNKSEEPANKFKAKKPPNTQNQGMGAQDRQESGDVFEQAEGKKAKSEKSKAKAKAARARRKAVKAQIHDNGAAVLTQLASPTGTKVFIGNEDGPTHDTPQSITPHEKVESQSEMSIRPQDQDESSKQVKESVTIPADAPALVYRSLGSPETHPIPTTVGNVAKGKVDIDEHVASSHTANNYSSDGFSEGFLDNSEMFSGSGLEWATDLTSPTKFRSGQRRASMSISTNFGNDGSLNDFTEPNSNRSRRVSIQVASAEFLQFGDFPIPAVALKDNSKEEVPGQDAAAPKAASNAGMDPVPSIVSGQEPETWATGSGVGAQAVGDYQLQPSETYDNENVREDPIKAFLARSASAKATPTLSVNGSVSVIGKYEGNQVQSPHTTHHCFLCREKFLPTVAKPLYFCWGCGPNSVVRYCSSACLLANSLTHAAHCVQLAAIDRLPSDSNLFEFPSEYCYHRNALPNASMLPLSPEKFRQKAFSMYCYRFGDQFPPILSAWMKTQAPEVAQNVDLNESTKQTGDYHVFRSEQTNPEARTICPAAEVIYTIKLHPWSFMKAPLNRALNAAFFCNDDRVVEFLFRLLRHLLVNPHDYYVPSPSDVSHISVLEEFHHQFSREFEVNMMPRLGEPDTFDFCREWEMISHNLDHLERQYPILRAWLRETSSM